ncbi:MAG: DUF4160 domain-containing protein [Deltaproteobacteria bacterium]|jgi:hypothetical protein|nr:DUF4160 domain-containing protein [Deltaproteobacteria bacterium]
MPVISMFYGIIITMYYSDHNPPHFHADFQGQKAVFDFDGNVLTGSFPPKKVSLVKAWVILHVDELIANWELAKLQQTLYKINPLV